MQMPRAQLRRTQRSRIVEKTKMNAYICNSAADWLGLTGYGFVAVYFPARNICVSKTPQAK